jgi:hypothetical protein
LLLCVFTCNAQAKLKVKYTVVRESSIIDIMDTLVCYYIIDSSSSIIIDKEQFYAFTFDIDSTVRNGFINFNNENKRIRYIDKDKVGSHGSSYVEEVKMSNFRSSKLSSFGLLGANLCVTSRRSRGITYLSFENKGLMPSHTLYISKLIYSGQSYPKKILFAEKGTLKSYMVLNQVIEGQVPE